MSCILKWFLAFALVLVFFMRPLYAEPSGLPGNETCPVMVDEKVKPEFFVEYEGRKVFFCCKFCKAQFLKTPKKYLSNLPPTAALHKAAATKDTDHEHSKSSDVVVKKNMNRSATSSHDHDHDHGNRLVAFLGKLHPMAIHFPIALVIMALVAELLFLVSHKELFLSSSRFLFPAGAVGAFAAVGLGWLAAFPASYPNPLSFVLEQHRWFGVAAMIVSVLGASAQLVAHGKKSNPRWSWIYRVLLVVAVGLIGWTGHLGGSLVYGIDYLKF